MAAAATTALIVKTDGQPTGAMVQATVMTYLTNVINEAGMNNRRANLSQALNDVFNGNGKPTGAYLYKGKPVIHASSGNGQVSASLFWTMVGSQASIFAMGEHVTSTSYKIVVFGQKDTDFAADRTIRL
jgi:hypothetical protein